MRELWWYTGLTGVGEAPTSLSARMSSKLSTTAKPILPAYSSATLRSKLTVTASSGAAATRVSARLSSQLRFWAAVSDGPRFGALRV